MKNRKLTVPTMAIGGATVGEATFRQLEQVAVDVENRLVPDGGRPSLTLTSKI